MSDDRSARQDAGTSRQHVAAAELRAREIKILKALGESVMLGKQIARSVGRKYNSSIRRDLADMVRFGLLVRNARGYVRGHTRADAGRG